MSTVSTPRTTAYATYVFSNLPPTVKSGGGLYNYEELAAMVGLKPTHNFRKRVKDLVAAGVLEFHAAFTPLGGIEARYSTVEVQAPKETPF